MKVFTTYQLVKDWYINCEELMNLYAADDSLTMDIEWAIFQNYRILGTAIQQCNAERKALEEEHGTLQDDGSRILDRSCQPTMVLYNRALEEMMNRRFRINIEKINHKSLAGKSGVTLETMSLFDFMIY